VSLGKLTREAGKKVTRTRPLPVLIFGVVVVLVLVVLAGAWVSLGSSSSLLLLAIFVFGVGVALAAPNETKETRQQAWSELGIGLLVAGLLAFAVWMVAEARRPIEEREALQAMLGFERDMPGVYLRDKQMEGFDLSGRNLEGADLSDSQLDNATLVEANLSGADLSGADLSEANLEAADLSNADLTGADLGGAIARRTDLHQARLLEADLSEAELSNADLRGVCLAQGSLVEASLPGAHLNGAALTGTDVEGARFWLDLKSADLERVSLGGAEHTNEALWPPGFEERAEELAASGHIPPPRLVSEPRRGTRGGTVLGAVDGDTVLIVNWSGRRKLRPIGIDAPELGEAGGGAARMALRTLLPREDWVRFSYDRRRKDKAGRELVYLFGSDGKLVNQQMLRKGVAVASLDPADRRAGLRNARYAARLAATEAWARQGTRGLWTTCPP
jgi:uncharacterized protein YjbI with pentapeptide repeats/endonuclease YncB( thermonuclease family)